MRRRRSDAQQERGQGLVEFALVVPIVLLLVVSVAELGVMFGNAQSLGYGSREGARVGSALANGVPTACAANSTTESRRIDALLVAAVQRILKSPDSGIKLPKVQQIRIFQATSTGAETANRVNVWTYAGPGAGPEVDPGPGTEFIDFVESSVQWPACSRVNGGANPDSVGVTVRYTYDFVMPLGTIINSVAGGRAQVTLNETTVMALNPTI
jgi:Flp pilus assembly protein TadG